MKVNLTLRFDTYACNISRTIKAANVYKNYIYLFQIKSKNIVYIIDNNQNQFLLNNITL